MIFEQYATGDGLGKVAKALIAKGRKDGGGRLKWIPARSPASCAILPTWATASTTVPRPLTYWSTAEEEQRRGNLHPEKGKFSPHHRRGTLAPMQRHPPKPPAEPAGRERQAPQVRRHCSQERMGHQAGVPLRFQAAAVSVEHQADGTQVYGFECYRHKKQSALYLKKHGLPEGICELKAFPEWKLELMARKIFETVWGNRREAVLEACRMLNACYREESTDPAKLKALDKRMDALNQRLDNLIMMKASNQITLSSLWSRATRSASSSSGSTRRKRNCWPSREITRRWTWTPSRPASAKRWISPTVW